MTYNLLDWYLAIFGSVVLLVGGELAGIVGRSLDIKILKKGLVVTSFGAIFLVVMAVFGPPHKPEIRKEITQTIMVLPETKYRSPYHAKIIADVEMTTLNHGKRPSKDHVAYKGNWILGENLVKLKTKEREEATE